MMLLYVLAMGLTISFISYVAFIAIPFLRRKPFAAGDPSQFT
ncbi:hypothetical protein Lxx01950 [Leifsonia xyli subsp. xyli str. CTCB07]|uniref:Uncharacterized protein n=1 Tax=Leifsonia xyli subsp. xyli (strain CTCB07) TaxID=281090 RepID=Q6AH92_LEIXX|nr:hypothetical protein [Leifsonia xyli]AAT88253.1 hypothetical protein Lxx01950 [Leifsonia xyli subsp. xyli str. CTCB07]